MSKGRCEAKAQEMMIEPQVQVVGKDGRLEERNYIGYMCKEANKKLK